MGMSLGLWIFGFQITLDFMKRNKEENLLDYEISRAGREESIGVEPRYLGDTVNETRVRDRVAVGALVAQRPLRICPVRRGLRKPDGHF
jgi:hypothetical protein